MPLSFTFRKVAFPPAEPGKPKTVLVTGAAGNIGYDFARHSRDRYRLRLFVHHPRNAPGDLCECGEVVGGDLADVETLRRACAGVETVVHLAGEPSPSATWDSLREANIEGTLRLLTAAKNAGCRRVILASSIHAVSGYPPDMQVKTVDPVNPGDLYGVSKCFVEALGRYFAEQEGLSVIAVRIGAFQSVAKAQDPSSLAMMDAFISPRDLRQLLWLCIDDDRLQFAIFNGLGANRFKRQDLSDARELLRYDPQDDFAAENPQLAPLDLENSVISHNLSDVGQTSGLRDVLEENQ